MRLSYAVSVSSAGPDDAGNGFVDLSQSPVIAPNLRFSVTNCSGTRCVLGTLASAASSSHEWLRFLVRMLLTPLVLAIAFPLRAGVLLAVVLALALRLLRGAPQ